MSLIRRFVQAFDNEDQGSAEAAGLVQLEDESVVYIKPDGTRVTLGDGGSMPQPQPRVLFDSNRDVGGGGQWIYIAERTGITRVSALSDYSYFGVWDRSTYTRCAYVRYADYEHNPAVAPTVAVQPDLTDPASVVDIVPDPGGGLSIGTVCDWSPDGSLIAYIVNGDADGASLHVCEPDGSNDVEVVPPSGTGSPKGNIVGARFSPDGTQLAVCTLDDVLWSAISVVNVDGTGRTLVLTEALITGDGSSGEAGWLFAWTKYGQFVVGWKDHGTGIAQVWFCDPDGGNLVKTSNVTGAGQEPLNGTVNPDNDQIIYATGGAGALQQATLDVVASSLLTSGGFADENPAYG